MIARCLNALSILIALNFLRPVMGEPRKFLIISNAVNGTISYTTVSWEGNKIVTSAVSPLITDALIHPQGLAVDQYRKRLLVGDPNLNKLVMYELSSNGDTLTAGEQKTVANDVEVRWVTTDGIGNVYFTDELDNSILKVSAEKVDDADATPQVLYNNKDLVSSPGGLTTDNFYLYWVNKADGLTTGSVVRAPVTGEPASFTSTREVSSAPTALAMNSNKSYGICSAINMIFYTGNQVNLYGVEAHNDSSPARVLSSKLNTPRGCAWDGAQTMYVADRASGAIYSWPLVNEPSKVSLTKIMDFNEAFGIAFYSGACKYGDSIFFSVTMITLFLSLGIM